MTKNVSSNYTHLKVQQSKKVLFKSQRKIKRKTFNKLMNSLKRLISLNELTLQKQQKENNLVTHFYS